MPVSAFNPRGTSGSGKTTIVRAILDAANAKPSAYEGKKVRMYRGELNRVPLYVIGSYESTCGGCDTIPSVHIAASMITDVMNTPGPGVLIYEGLMISHMIGTVGATVAPYGERHVMGFLDTPLFLCLERVQARRRARGDDRPFNPTNTVKDYANVERCKRNALTQGFRVTTIDHTRAVDHSMEIINELSELSLVGEVGP